MKDKTKEFGDCGDSVDFSAYLQYEPLQGLFFYKTAKQKQIKPKEDGYVYVTVNNKRTKLRANKLAYELGTGRQVPKGKVVLHKNLNTNDYRLNNLVVLSNKIFNKIKEAQRNLSGQLKIQPHKYDCFCYVLSWKEGAQTRYKIVHDIISARKLYLELQLKFAKVLGKYLVSDE